MSEATQVRAFDAGAARVFTYEVLERMRVDNALAVMLNSGAVAPEPLKVAVDARDAAAEVAADAMLFADDLERAAYACRADQVAGMLDEFAQRRVIANSLLDLRNVFLEVLNRRVRHEFMKAAPNLLAGMRESFLDVAGKFTEAVHALPARRDPQTLIEAGPEAVGAWHRAVELSATLDTLAAAYRAVYRQPRRLDLAVACEFSAPENWAQASRLAVALHEGGRMAPWIAIVDLGVAIAWHTREEVDALIARLTEDQPNWVPSTKGWVRKTEQADNRRPRVRTIR